MIEDGKMVAKAIKHAEENIKNFAEYKELLESLKCCGNCGNRCMPACLIYYVGMIDNDYEQWQYCDKWTTDSLTQKERMSK